MMDYALICRTAQDLGVKIMPGDPLSPGDHYFAHRNGPVKLLTVREVKDGYVVPVEIDYCYDINECIKTEL